MTAMVVDAAEVSQTVSDLETLEAVRPTRVSGLQELSGANADWQPLLMSRGVSRSGWFFSVTEQIVRRMGTHALDFMTSKGLPDQRWRFDAMELEEEEEEMEGISLPVYGHLFDGEAIDRTIDALTSLFTWSRVNIGVIENDFDVGYYASSADILDAMDRPVACLEVHRDTRVDYAEDGTGPWFLFSWLYSLRCVFETARASGRAVVVCYSLPPTG